MNNVPESQFEWIFNFADMAAFQTDSVYGKKEEMKAEGLLRGSINGTLMILSLPSLSNTKDNCAV